MIKKTIRTLAVLAVLALTAWGISTLMEDKQEVIADACAINMQALNLLDPEGKLKTDDAVVRAMFDHYFSFYKDMPQCPGTNLLTAKLVGIENIKSDDTGHIQADITFDLKPGSLEKTKWITDETSTTSDGWIKGKKGSLSIQPVSSSTYFLII